MKTHQNTAMLTNVSSVKPFPIWMIDGVLFGSSILQNIMLDRELPADDLPSLSSRLMLSAGLLLEPCSNLSLPSSRAMTLGQKRAAGTAACFIKKLPGGL